MELGRRSNTPSAFEPLSLYRSCWRLKPLFVLVFLALVPAPRLHVTPDPKHVFSLATAFVACNARLGHRLDILTSRFWHQGPKPLEMKLVHKACGLSFLCAMGATVSEHVTKICTSLERRKAHKWLLSSGFSSTFIFVQTTVSALVSWVLSGCDDDCRLMLASRVVAGETPRAVVTSTIVTLAMYYQPARGIRHACRCDNPTSRSGGGAPHPASSCTRGPSPSPQ